MGHFELAGEKGPSVARAISSVAEQRTLNPCVAGSNPAWPTTRHTTFSEPGKTVRHSSVSLRVAQRQELNLEGFDSATRRN